MHTGISKPIGSWTEATFSVNKLLVGSFFKITTFPVFCKPTAKRSPARFRANCLGKEPYADTNAFFVSAPSSLEISNEAMLSVGG
jgi:hypothetical protein